MTAVILASLPPRGFYDVEKSSTLPDLSYRRLLSIPPYRRRLAESEISSGTIELENSDGFLSDILATPPLGVAVSIYDAAASLIMTGYITACTIQGAILSLSVES